MRKSALFLIFFVLTLFVNAQDKMGFGNDTEGADSAGFGTVTTWVKPSINYDYEGILTVGYRSTEYQEIYGYVIEDIGAISPINDDIYGIYYITDGTEKLLDASLILETYVIDSVYIDEVGFKLTEGSVYVLSNPFPELGETCSIKLKYTLP